MNLPNMHRHARRGAALAGWAALIAAPAAQARDGLDLSLGYVADLSVSASGGADQRLRYLDNLEAALDADLGALAGLDGAQLHIGVLNNLGARPNDGALSLQGVDNIEVPEASPHLLEAWAQQQLGKASLRLGLYDLNSEFYASESAGLLIAPPFGIGSELAASGPAGPSIFPSSALAARLRIDLGGGHGYAQAAVLNARAQTLGDPGGVDLSFDDGLIVIGEAGVGKRLRVGLGGWTYTRPRDALFATDAAGQPLRQRPAGIYGLVEAHVAQGGPRAVTLFLRGGAARGQTQPFGHSLQAGVLVSPALIGRDDSAFSIGVHRAGTSADFRAAQVVLGEPAWQRESVVEVTYADALTPFLTVQPDLQWIEQRGANGAMRRLVHATLRLSFAF